jgi:hypothetical protein
MLWSDNSNLPKQVQNALVLTPQNQQNISHLSFIIDNTRSSEIVVKDEKLRFTYVVTVFHRIFKEYKLGSLR